MFNAKTLSAFIALASLVSLTPEALADSNNECQLRGRIIARGSISTANGGRAEAQRRLLANGTELSMLTEYDQAGKVTRRLVWFETKVPANKSAAVASKESPLKTKDATKTEIAANR